MSRLLGTRCEYRVLHAALGKRTSRDGARSRGVYTNLPGTFDSKEWQDFCTSDGLTCDEMIKNDALGTFHANQYVAHQKLIEQVGAAAITGE